MSENCIFCKISAGKIPAEKIYEDDQILAFYDVQPRTPVHVLVIPKQHIASLGEVTEEHREIMGYLLERTAHVARVLGVSRDGYRVIVNTNDHGGQEVFHIHLHLLAGRRIGAMVSM